MESKKDFIMRIIQLLLDLLGKISNNINEKNLDDAKKQLDYSYKLLNNNKSFFTTSSLEDLTTFFKIDEDKHNLKKIEILGKLFFYEAKLGNEKSKKVLLKKSKEMFQYYLQNSEDFSLGIINYMNKIDFELGKK
ncbi:hypothetical protein MHTCC0001_16570 [Flavobacteriaceae bacterium MHTCC 0001]